MLFLSTYFQDSTVCLWVSEPHFVIKWNTRFLLESQEITPVLYIDKAKLIFPKLTVLSLGSGSCRIKQGKGTL